MTHVQDFTIRNGVGIRIVNGQTCQVIRRLRGVWKEIGRKYELPLGSADLHWTGGIPATVIAVALRAYELDHPGSALRAELTGAKYLRAAS